MTGVLLVEPPRGVIQRIGSRNYGGPLAWPSLAWIRSPRHGEPPGGANRFDDPRGANTEFTVLYGAERRETCFAETLAQFRVRREANAFAEAVAAIPALESDDPLNFDDATTVVVDPRAARRIPDHFFAEKVIGLFRIVSTAPLLDARITATATAEALSRDPRMTVRPIKPGDFVGDNRAKTQAVALWAFRMGLGGVLYTSSHNLRHDWECVALFPVAEIEPVGDPIPVERDDPALLDIANRFGLIP